MAICVITRNKYRNMYTIKSTYFIAPFQHMSHKKVETCPLLQIKSERSKYLALFHLKFTKNRHRYRPQGKVIFFRSVCQSFCRGGGSGRSGGGAASERGLPTGGSAYSGVCLRGGGVCIQRGLPMGSLPTGGLPNPPCWQPLQRSVHILLECILVLYNLKS